MASLFDNFTQAQPNNQQQQQTTGQQSANANPTVPNANNTLVQGTVDGNANQQQPAESPLAKFSELWKNDPNAPTDAPFSFNSDPNKLMEAAKTVDFTKVVSPELMARVNAGGTSGQQAMMEAMNNVAQLTFAQASLASSKISEQAVAAAEDRFKSMLPNLIKQHQVADSVRQENPLLTNPAAAPMVQTLQEQMTRKFPQATASEIKTHVNEYLNSMADLITSNRPKPAEVKTGRADTDWSQFLN